MSRSNPVWSCNLHQEFSQKKKIIVEVYNTCQSAPCLQVPRYLDFHLIPVMCQRGVAVGIDRPPQIEQWACTPLNVMECVEYPPDTRHPLAGQSSWPKLLQAEKGTEYMNWQVNFTRSPMFLTARSTLLVYAERTNLMASSLSTRPIIHLWKRQR